MPYLSAYQAYVSHGPPDIPWTDFIARHIAHGIVVSLPDCFLAARVANHRDTDDDLLTLPAVSDFPPSLCGRPDCWHIGIASGTLPALAQLFRIHPLPWISFEHRGRVRRIPANRIFRHGSQIRQNTAAASPSAAARIGHRP